MVKPVKHSNSNSNSHPQRLVAAGVLLLMLLTACDEPSSLPSTSAAEGPQQQAVPSTSHGPSGVLQGKADMSALETILGVFSDTGGDKWPSYDAVSGIVWRDAAPVESPGSPAAPFKRGGNLLLSGFGMIDVPNGETGAEAGSRQDNEGNSGLTLLGTADRVESIVVMKFYPSEDYAAILKNQFGPGAAIERIAHDCAGEQADPEAREFYRLAGPDGAADVYAEIYVDAEGGKYSPGSTTFEFHRSEPADRIKSLGCTVIGKN